MRFSNWDFRFSISGHSLIPTDSRVLDGLFRPKIEIRKSKIENSRSFRTTP